MCVKDGDKVSVSAAFVSGRTHPEDQSQVNNLNTFSQKIQCFINQKKKEDIEPYTAGMTENHHTSQSFNYFYVI